MTHSNYKITLIPNGGECEHEVLDSKQCNGDVCLLKCDVKCIKCGKSTKFADYGTINNSKGISLKCVIRRCESCDIMFTVCLYSASHRKLKTHCIPLGKYTYDYNRKHDFYPFVEKCHAVDVNAELSFMGNYEVKFPENTYYWPTYLYKGGFFYPGLVDFCEICYHDIIETKMYRLGF